MFSSGSEEAGAGNAVKHLTFWGSTGNGLNIRHICINTKIVNKVFYKSASLVPITVRELLRPRHSSDG
jgi:hypothetical protein